MITLLRKRADFPNPGLLPISSTLQSYSFSNRFLNLATELNEEGHGDAELEHAWVRMQDGDGESTVRLHPSRPCPLWRSGARAF